MTAARRGAVALALVAAVGVAAVSGARLSRLVAERPGEELLYLPNGEQLRILSLGHASLLADAIYLWAIQYYSNYEGADRGRYVEHVFRGVITELDPHYIDAYWLGALILIVEFGEIDAGLGLLDKGIERNPERWILPYLAAWESHHAGRFAQAEGYFRRAAALPDAPPVVRRAQAGMRTKAGDLDGALALWRQIADDPRSDAGSVAVARRQLAQLDARLELERLERAVERFRAEHGRHPGGLGELGTVAGVRLAGGSYAYDAKTGKITRRSARRVVAGD